MAHSKRLQKLVLCADKAQPLDEPRWGVDPVAFWCLIFQCLDWNFENSIDVVPNRSSSSLVVCRSSSWEDQLDSSTNKLDTIDSR